MDFYFAKVVFSTFGIYYYILYKGGRQVLSQVLTFWGRVHS